MQKKKTKKPYKKVAFYPQQNKCQQLEKYLVVQHSLDARNKVLAFHCARGPVPRAIVLVYAQGFNLILNVSYQEKATFLCFQILFSNTEKAKKVKETVILKTISGVESYSLPFKKYFQFGKDKNIQKGQASRVLSKDPSQFPYNIHVCLDLASFSPLVPF